MLITIDFSADTPLFEQIAAAIRTEIIAAETQPGQRIPPASELADSLSVNRNTVLHAYQLLRDEGLIELRRGRGASVTPHAARLTELATAVDALVADARELDVTPTTLLHLIKEAYS